MKGNETVIELINRIGSAFYGPVAAVFLMGVVMKKAGGFSAVLGLATGTALNLILWRWVPGISWLWWNVLGCMGSLAAGYGVALFFRANRRPYMGPAMGLARADTKLVYVLAGWFAVIFGVSLLIHACLV